jgi:hypothetical protein
VLFYLRSPVIVVVVAAALVAGLIRFLI